jgi:hypothetical protein
MFPRALLDCRLQSLSWTTYLREKIRAELLFTSTMPAHAEEKNGGAARIIPFKLQNSKRGAARVISFKKRAVMGDG